MRTTIWVLLAAAPVLACGSGQNTNGPGGSATNGTGGTTTSGVGPASAPITTVAGKGPSGQGFANGDGGRAEFYNPAGLSIDHSSDLYVADNANNAIRKVDPNGIVSIVAGMGFGQHGLINGSSKNAEFWNPLGVAVDSTGNIYIADTANNAVRKIDSHGSVSTLVGPQLGGAFVASGPGALVRQPSGVAVDSSGNVYVSDSGNNAIRKVDTSGNVTTILHCALGFADGDASTGKFQPPLGIAVDSSGNIYFVDQQNNAIRKIDTSGNLSTLAGKGPTAHGFIDGDVTTAELFQPFGVTVDSAGNLYFSDQRNNAIRKIDTKGNVTTLAGHGPSKAGFVDGDAGTAELDYPTGVALDSAGNVFFADQNNNAIRRYAP